MNDFERDIEKTFPAYADANVASLMVLHPRMRAVGMHGKLPCYIQVARAPYDLAGYYLKGGRAIGVELKSTTKRENRLPLLGPDKRGDGLQYHQLQALVDLHQAGGQALLLWNNAGEVGLLDGHGLHLTLLAFNGSLAAEKANKDVARGSRSILWGMFRPVQLDDKGVPLWLPNDARSA